MTTTTSGSGRPVTLAILDGWGSAPDGPGNAITRSGLTHLPRIFGASPCLLDASGAAVGLPDGVMGNSEVGHVTMGAGRVIEQDLVRIDKACASGSIGALPAFRDAVRAVRAGSGRLHLMGLCSDAGVHAHVAHLRALCDAALAQGVSRVFVHAFTDGRDTPPDSALAFVGALEVFLSQREGARLATVQGRYWAMDRDERWERTERSVRALVLAEGSPAPSGVEAVRRSHASGVTDEFVEPAIVDAAGTVRDGDGIVFTNFRADRARQLTRALADPAFTSFDAPRRTLATFVTMTQYDARLELPVLFAPQAPQGTLGQAFAQAGWRQLRLAETEKYAHVTYFLDGGREAPFEGEERILVPSQKVATYDLAPAMSAQAIARHAIDWISAGGSRLLVVNFANADMVGHTGMLVPTEEACRVVDACVGRLAEETARAGAALLVTADHGNAETMLDESGRPHTAHTTHRVPCGVVDGRAGSSSLRASGTLSDVAPTVLALAGLPAPESMTGRSLLA